MEPKLSGVAKYIYAFLSCISPDLKAFVKEFVSAISTMTSLGFANPPVWGTSSEKEVMLFIQPIYFCSSKTQFLVENLNGIEGMCNIATTFLPDFINISEL